MELNTYLSFNGNCAEGFKHYERLSEARSSWMMTHGDSPMAAQTAPEDRDRVRHVRLQAGDSILMGSDNPSEINSEPKGFSVAQTFWAKRFAMFRDRFGIPWMITCE